MSSSTGSGEIESIILVMGQTGHGVSTFVKSLLEGKDKENIEIGNGCLSCTQTSTCWPITIGHNTLYLVETPGLNHTTIPTVAWLASLLANISACSLLDVKIKGIFFVVDMTSKVGALTLHHLRLLEALAGKDAHRNIALVTTKWDAPGERSWKLEIRDVLMTDVFGKIFKGAETYNFEGDAETIVTSLNGKQDVELQIQKELKTSDLKVWNTSAMKELKAMDARVHGNKIKNRLSATTMSMVTGEQSRFISMESLSTKAQVERIWKRRLDLNVLAPTPTSKPRNPGARRLSSDFSTISTSTTTSTTATTTTLPPRKFTRMHSICDSSSERSIVNAYLQSDATHTSRSQECQSTPPETEEDL